MGPGVKVNPAKTCLMHKTKLRKQTVDSGCASLISRRGTIYIDIDPVYRDGVILLSTRFVDCPDAIYRKGEQIMSVEAKTAKASNH